MRNKFFSVFNINFLTILFLALALLPRACDDFHRLKTLELRTLSFYPFVFKVNFFHFQIVHLQSGLVGESKCSFISFSVRFAIALNWFKPPNESH